MCPKPNICLIERKWGLNQKKLKQIDGDMEM
jgi:hypothetical protein